MKFTSTSVLPKKATPACWRILQLRQRAIAVSSFGKTYHMTGWKVGYCVAPAAISAELRKVHQYLTFAVNTPAQLALADMLRASQNITVSCRNFTGRVATCLLMP
jgi:methionine aminotransferase